MAAARFGAMAAVLVLVLGACEESSSNGGSSGTAAPSGGTAPGGGGSGGTAAGGTFTLRPQSLVGRADMAGLAQSVKAFQVDMDRLPTNGEGLEVLLSADRLERDADKWRGPYVPGREYLIDTYGTAVEYERTGDGFLLRSLGADGQRGGTGSSADIELRQRV